jgi:F-type H+-transporting ATPase subunit a
MMKRALYISGLSLILFLTASPVWASNQDEAKEELNAKEFITEHLADSYEWQIVSNGTKYIAIPLPVILHSKTTGWHLFPSSHFHHGANSYKGFEIAAEGKYKGKIMETDADGSASRPLDLSLTKNAASLLFASLLVILIIMGVAHSLKRDPMKPGKGSLMIEMLVLSINDEVIKPSIGKDYQRYAPYLLTVFFLSSQTICWDNSHLSGGANVTEI